MKQKPKYNELQNVSFMLRTAWKKEKSVIFLCVIIAAMKVAVNLAQLYLAPAVLAKVEAAAPLGELLGTIGLFALSLLLLNGVLSYVECNTIFGRIGIRTVIVNKINNKALTTSYPNTRNKDILRHQEKAMQACNSNRAPTENIWKTLTGILMNVVGFGIYLGLLSGIDPFLLVVTVLTTLVGFFVSRRIHEWDYRHKDELAEHNSKMQYIIKKSESVEMAKDIRIFGLAPWLKSIYQSALSLYKALIARREKNYIWAGVLDVALNLCRNGIAYFYLIRMTLVQQLPASQFLLYFTAVSGFTAWVTGILDEFSTLHKESLELSIVQEYLNLPEPFRFAGGIPIPKADSYEITLEKVSFRYPDTEKDTIHDLDLILHAGEKLALVGLNGAGKTTLVKLLCGFYDPDQGRVLLNGVDIRKFNRREYYALFSAVFQEYSVLDITVAETVAQQVENIDRDRVSRCLEQAGLTEKIRSFENGLDTHIGRFVYPDGVLLSGGETQRLMLARALYKDGPLLVLDEPTAALDPLAENDIYQKYNEMTAGKTALFISHRLASTRFCDRILFFADGGIAEEGTHESLLALGGGYAKLFAVQSRYYQEGCDWNGEI